VLLNSAAGGAEFDALAVANVQGATQMVEHLIALGHSRIAMIKGPVRNHDATERLRGYRAALREAGIAAEAALEAQGDFSDASGYAAGMELLRLSPRPTAIFAANDAMAIGALS